MISLGDHFPDGFHDSLEFLDGTHNAALDQLNLRGYGRPEFLQSGVIGIDVLDRVCGFWEFTQNVIFGCDGMEEDRKVLGEAAPGREKSWRRVIENTVCEEEAK